MTDFLDQIDLGIIECSKILHHSVTATSPASSSHQDNLKGKISISARRIWIKMIEVKLYFDGTQKYGESEIQELIRMIGVLRSENVFAVAIEKDELSEKSTRAIVDQIRKIRPQSRGSVVASRGERLPVSRNKNLNLVNTPVILVENESEPVYVFPCRLGENYYSVMDGLNFLSQNLPELPPLSSSSEESIVKILSSFPELMEKGLKFLGSEIQTLTGKIDMLFGDSAGTILAVEVEREANDASIGQILRLSEGYESEHRITRIRDGIVCLRINENVLLAARRANIEVWRISLNNQLSVSKVN